MNLTRTGEVFLQCAREIIDIKEKSYQKIASLSRMYTEYISIAVNRQTGSLLMSQILPIFKQEYPDVKININESDTYAAKQLLMNGSVDLALMGEAEEPHTLIDETFLYNEEIVLVIPKSHPMASRPIACAPAAPDLRDFQEDDFILSKPGTHFRMLVDRILKQHRIIPNIFCEINNFYAVRNMVENGFGIAFLHKSMVRDHENVVSLPLNPRFLYPIVIARHKTLALSQPMEHLVDVMKEYCRGQ